jgi:hypothetical protein
VSRRMPPLDGSDSLHDRLFSQRERVIGVLVVVALMAWLFVAPIWLPMAYVSDGFIGSWMLAYAIWGVKAEHRVKGSSQWWRLGPRMQRVMRFLALFIAACVAIDLWFRASGRGPFLR